MGTPPPGIRAASQNRGRDKEPRESYPVLSILWGGDTTPPPAEGGMGMEAPHPRGDRVKQPRPAPVIPLCPCPRSRSPGATASAFTGFPCSEIPRPRLPAPRPRRSGCAREGGAERGRGGPEPQPRPAGDSSGAAPCRAVPSRAVLCPTTERRLLQHQEQLQVWLRARPVEPCPAAPRRAEPFRSVPCRGSVPCPSTRAASREGEVRKESVEQVRLGCSRVLNSTTDTALLDTCPRLSSRILS
ncbi:uncharacterized protein LOC141728860 [Zonotrichia albicollis]|uniref:uncharacterized protein LOC141728860 n=1 Tax=Zonotrichia albicollis TaxID=44394 RepID=UPI003D80E5BF